MIEFSKEEEIVGKWFMEKTGKEFFGYRCLGVRRDGEWKAAILCDRFSKIECQMHIYAEPGFMWASPELCRTAFAFPFILLDRRRITVETPVTHPRMIRINRKLGFIEEGVKRCAADDGSDAIIFGMLREECKWIKD